MSSGSQCLSINEPAVGKGGTSQKMDCRRNEADENGGGGGGEAEQSKHDLQIPLLLNEEGEGMELFCTALKEGSLQSTLSRV